MRNIWAVAGMFLMFTFGLPAQTNRDARPSPERHTATSSIEFKSVGGKQHTLTRNQRFSVITICVNECSDYVLHESFFHDQEQGTEGGLAQVTVTAWERDTPNKNLWEIRAAGDDGAPYYDFYKAIRHGCCGDWNEIGYFSLRTGKRVYSASSDKENALLKIDVPNTRTTRYVAFSYPSFKVNVGRLQFGDGERVMQTVTITEASPERPPETTLRVAGKPDAHDVSLWPGNGDASSKTVSGVAVVLKFDSATVLIPIENDRLVVQKAKAPSGFKIKE